MLTNERSVSISLIRCIAVLFVILSHIMQYYNNFLAQWFNVAVQIFLFMSGFLFGAKNIDNTAQWYKNRFRRILKPYYIFIIIAITVIFTFNDRTISVWQVVYYILGIQGLTWMPITGLGHLWYITALILTGLITPLLYKIRSYINVKSGLKFYMLILSICVILQLALFKISPLLVSGIAIYIFGYFVGLRYKDNVPVMVKYVFLVFLMILLPIRIYTQYFYTGEAGLFIKLIDFSIPWMNAVMGITLFLFLFDLFSRLGLRHNSGVLMKVIHNIDKCSYEIYLTHGVFILGSFSLLSLTKSAALNIIAALTAALLSAFLLKKLSSIEMRKKKKAVR